MNIWITGQRGFIGRHVAALVREAGHRLIDEPMELQDVRPAVFNVIVPDLVIHCAWRGKSSSEHGLSDIESLSASAHLLYVLRKSGCKRFVNVGSCVDSYPSLNPIYSVAKKSFTEITSALACPEMSTVTARLFYCYGPHQDPERFIPSIMRAFLNGERPQMTNGEQVRDYLHVEDIAAAIWRIATSREQGVIDVASGWPWRLSHLAKSAAMACKVSPERIDFGALPYRNEPEVIAADPKRLYALGWQPHYSLMQGLTNTAQYWRTQLCAAV